MKKFTEKAALLITAAILLTSCTQTKEEIINYSTVDYQKLSFDIIEIPLSKINQIEFFYEKDHSKKFSTIENLKTWIETKDKKLLFATNGGIFSLLHSPMGLYIEDGQLISDINLEDGEGNFFLKPNGIFYLTEQNAEIIESSKFNSQQSTKHAIQSGPLLIENNKINPQFAAESSNKHIRSAVAKCQNNKIIFSISNQKVTFYELSSFLKNTQNCPDALYLDGAISEFYVPGYREEISGNFSTIIGVVN